LPVFIDFAPVFSWHVSARFTSDPTKPLGLTGWRADPSNSLVNIGGAGFDNTRARVSSSMAPYLQAYSQEKVLSYRPKKSARSPDYSPSRRLPWKYLLDLRVGKTTQLERWVSTCEDLLTTGAEDSPTYPARFEVRTHMRHFYQVVHIISKLLQAIHGRRIEPLILIDTWDWL